MLNNNKSTVSSTPFQYDYYSGIPNAFLFLSPRNPSPPLVLHYASPNVLLNYHGHILSFPSTLPTCSVTTIYARLVVCS